MLITRFKLLDWFSLVLIIALSSIGLAFVFSATYAPHAPLSIFFKKQCIGVITGLMLYLIFFFIDVRTLQQWGPLLYFVTIGLLIFTMIKGTIGLGAQRWINFGFVKFQPSEIAKLFFPAFFTYHLRNAINQPFTKKLFIPILFTLGISCLLILKQPDLGTALIILFSGLVMLWLAGIGKKFFFVGLAIIILGAPLGWKHLKPYQKKRIVVFLGGGTSNKERYQIEQSQIAIGSGGVWGKGYLQGTQNRFNFLPESRTDFIFAVICEEWGLVGALMVLGLFGALFLRLLYLIAILTNPYHQLLASGLLAPIIFSTIVNIGMVIGILPIVGIPLPFITYGITHLWMSFASLGWINNIVRFQAH